MLARRLSAIPGEGHNPLTAENGAGILTRMRFSALLLFGALGLVACKRHPAPESSAEPPPPAATPSGPSAATPPGPSAAAQAAHPGVGEPVHADVGKHMGIHQPKHVAHDPATDEPVVHKLRDLYQEDQTFANLFSSAGKSEICGPTSMSNVLLYLKHDHKPPFPKLFGHMKEGSEAKPIVEKMFQLCHTNKNSGTSAVDLKSCAEAAMKEAGYQPLVLRVDGPRSDVPAQQKPIGPAELRAEARSEWKPGAAPERSDRAAVLLFGWYHRGTYKRTGGHFVALAGYDAKHDTTVYVTNPLIKDYPKDQVYSKVALERAPKKTGDLPAEGMWQTEHLFGDNSNVIAVLEEMISALPKP